MKNHWLDRIKERRRQERLERYEQQIIHIIKDTLRKPKDQKA